MLLGAIAALMSLSMLLVGHLKQPPGAVAPPQSAILMDVIIYGVVAIALAWLGFGSVMAKRWARALMAIFSWSWLIVGVWTCAFMVFLMPRIVASMASTMASQPSGQSLPQEQIAISMEVGMGLTLGIGFVILPLIWTLFYSGRNVKATVEARDPVTRWTDRCPFRCWA